MSGIRVLLIEDSATDALIIERELQRAGIDASFHRVEREDELARALATERFDIALCDWTLPGFSGDAALRCVARSELDLPFVIVSGVIGEERAVEAMRAGARDYVPKDNLLRLAPVLTRELA